ncbi:MAG: nucleotide exchange factor GrpE [bacterium]
MSEDKKPINNEEIELLQAELEKMKLQVEEMRQLAEDNLNGWKRAQADYANFKRETEEKKKDLIEFANAAFMSEVLPVYNHFKLALKHIPEDQKKLDWIKGIEFIRRQFQDFLNKYKIIEIKTVGEKFDPNMHEAVVCEEKEGYKTDEIFEETMPGYMLGEKVINPAKVKVAK